MLAEAVRRQLVERMHTIGTRDLERFKHRKGMVSEQMSMKSRRECCHELEIGECRRRG